jgi:tRNA 2-thiouridine synthesizing protein A
MSEIIDARGLNCPLPVLRVEKRAASLKPGEGFTLLATDPVARVDVPHFCRSNGFTCDVSETDSVLRFEIARSE